MSDRIGYGETLKNQERDAEKEENEGPEQGPLDQPPQRPPFIFVHSHVQPLLIFAHSFYIWQSRCHWSRPWIIDICCIMNTVEPEKEMGGSK